VQGWQRTAEAEDRGKAIDDDQIILGGSPQVWVAADGAKVGVLGVKAFHRFFCKQELGLIVRAILPHLDVAEDEPACDARRAAQRETRRSNGLGPVRHVDMCTHLS
jgi:hypothetical protein